MKRKFVFICCLLVCSLVFNMTVKADNGPANIGALNINDYYTENDYHSHYLYYPNSSLTIDPLEGSSYDLETNTLTLNNIKGPYEIAIMLMGEDFKINVVGYNEIRNIVSYSDKDYITNVNIIGDGTLIINKDLNDKDEPIYIYNGNLVVEENVNLIMYAPATSDDDDYEPLLVEVYNDFDSSNTIQFKNNQQVEIVSDKRKKMVNGIAFIEDPDDSPYEIKIVTKDEKKYALEKVGNSYYVSKVELMKYNDYYFLDVSTVEDVDDINQLAYSFASEEEVSDAGYVIGDTITINYRTYFEYGFYVLEDSDGNEYAVYADDDRFVFDFTDDIIKLKDNNDYTAFKVNENFNIEDNFYYVNGDKLKLVYDAFEYKLEGTEYTTNIKKEEKNNNPKTGDSIIEITLVLVISLLVLVFNKKHQMV